MREDQFKRPTGEEGRAVIHHMNDHHRGVTEWGLSVIPDIEPKTVLDIGCGGGLCLSLLGKKYPYAELNGVDISEESVRATRSYNQELVDEGRLKVIEGDVSDLPFNEAEFDLITAVETYFFWPDLENDIRKVSRLLAKNGMFVIVSEVSVTENNIEEVTSMNNKYGSKVIDNDTILGYMGSADPDVELFLGPERSWVAFIGKKVN